MLKVAVYASSDESFQKVASNLRQAGFADENISFADSRKQSRLDVINQNTGQWIFFMDHDCVLSTANKSQLESFIRKYSEGEAGVVVGGLYRNSTSATRLQRAHNWIANTWVELSYRPRAKPVILGGCFLIHTQHQVSGELPLDMWGAEDKLLAQILNLNRFHFYFHPELRVEHETSGQWRHFLRRAWLHGQNDIEDSSGATADRRYSEWLKKIVSADFDLIALILLHFCIQKTAKRVRPVLRTNKQST